MSQTAWRPNWTVHPGEMLADLLEERGWSQSDLGRAWCVTPPYINGFIKSSRSFTPRVALLLEATFGTPPEFWLNLQRDYDLHRARQEMAAELEIIRETAGG